MNSSTYAFLALAAAVQFTMSAASEGQPRTEDKTNARKVEIGKLDEKEKGEIKGLIREFGIRREHSFQGRWAHIDILVIPERIRELYRKSPRQTLQYLLKCIEDDPPEHANCALGYAYTLTTSPVVGYAVTERDLTMFDKPNKVLGITDRKRFADQVRETIDDLDLTLEEAIVAGKIPR